MGAGSVGATLAYNLALKGAVTEIALIDSNTEKAEAEILDIKQGASLGRSVKIEATGYEACRGQRDRHHHRGGAPAAGRVPRGPHGAQRRHREGHRAFDQGRRFPGDPADHHQPRGRADVGRLHGERLPGLTASSAPAPRWTPRGCASTLPAAAASTRRTSTATCWASTATPPSPRGRCSPSAASISTSSARSAASARDQGDFKKNAAEDVRRTAYKIIEAKGSTCYAIGQAASLIVEAIVRDERRILPVSTARTDFGGIAKTAFSFPTIVGREGVVQVLKFKLAPGGREAPPRLCEVRRGEHRARRVSEPRHASYADGAVRILFSLICRSRHWTMGMSAISRAGMTKNCASPEVRASKIRVP